MSYNAEHNFAQGSSFTACSSAFRKAPSFLSVRSFFISLLNHNLGRGCPELNEITALLIHIALGLTLKPCHGDFNKYARNIIDEKSWRYRKPAVNICRLLLLSEGHGALQLNLYFHVFISLSAGIAPRRDRLGGSCYVSCLTMVCKHSGLVLVTFTQSLQIFTVK